MFRPYRNSSKRPAIDRFNVPTIACSFRRLLTSYRANKAINVIRASDSATLDIGFTGKGDLDIQTLNSFLNGTTGKIVTWYDQSGNGFNLTQGTDASRPAITVNSLGVFPIAIFTAATISLVAASNITPATGTISYSLVSRRTAGTGVANFRPTASNTNNSLGPTGSGAYRLIAGAAALNNGNAAESTWHIAQALANGASSVISIDGLDNSGSTTLNTTAGAPGMIGAASTTFNIVEAVMWDNLDNTIAGRTALSNNQRRYWGLQL